MNRSVIFTAVISSVLTTLVICGIALGVLAMKGFISGPNSLSGATSTPVTSPEEQAVIAAVKKANPAVVSIVITKNAQVYKEVSPFSDNLFNFFLPQYQQEGP